MNESTFDYDRLQVLAARIADRQRTKTATSLETASTALPVLQLAETACRRTDGLLAKSAEKAQRDCRAGCSSCCYLQVAITIPEAILIATRLRETRSPEAFETLRGKFRDMRVRLRRSSIEQRARMQVPCVLLGADGACSIYAFRPIGCRGYTSFSKNACDAARTAEQPGHDGPLDRIAWAAASAVSEGLSAGLRDSAVDSHHYEFHSVVSPILDEPLLTEAWQRGEDVFGDCLQVKSERLLGRGNMMQSTQSDKS
ncbi:MAG: YkgJ family cysteine cluster protein [Phycisphaerae bacterium]